MRQVLDFEEQIIALEEKISELKRISTSDEYGFSSELSEMEKKVEKLLQKTYSSLTPWQKVQVARHEERPQFLDYSASLIKDFIPLAGDRKFGEDAAIIGGIGRFDGYSVMAIGHQKGTDTASRLKHNFGYARPEGYRKVARLMELAEQFNLPILMFVNTPGAYPGIDAEERGQSEAIARSIEACLKVKTPIISTIIGEGGSGGAIAMAVADTVMMLEHSVYSVISPEGCASILWKDSDKKQVAAEALKITAQDLIQLKVIDHIIPEAIGGAHRHREDTIQNVGRAISKAMQSFIGMDGGILLAKRRQKFLEIGRNL